MVIDRAPSRVRQSRQSLTRPSNRNYQRQLGIVPGDGRIGYPSGLQQPDFARGFTGNQPGQDHVDAENSRNATGDRRITCAIRP